MEAAIEKRQARKQQQQRTANSSRTARKLGKHCRKVDCKASTVLLQTARGAWSSPPSLSRIMTWTATSLLTSFWIWTVGKMAWQQAAGIQLQASSPRKKVFLNHLVQQLAQLLFVGGLHSTRVTPSSFLCEWGIPIAETQVVQVKIPRQTNRPTNRPTNKQTNRRTHKTNSTHLTSTNNTPSSRLLSMTPIPPMPPIWELPTILFVLLARGPCTLHSTLMCCLL